MIRTGKELATACENVAKNYKTLYIMGCIGAPMNESNTKRYTMNYAYNAKADRKPKILASSADTFGMDCVCMVKTLLWGWNGDTSKVYGGAVYASNGVPDIGTEQIIGVCSGVTADFSKITVGELLWMQGHVGIYIGNGLAVECTPAWNDGVQITAVHNIGKKSGYNGRSWTKHGKLPYVTYGVEEAEDVKTETPAVMPTVNPTTSSTGGCTLTLPMLQKGSRGETVKALQILLIGTEPGYSCGRYGVDGDFGSATENAVRNFQRNNGLEVDGIAGPITWAKLLCVK